MLLKRLARRAAAILIVCLFGTNVSFVAAGEPPNFPTGTGVLGGWVYIDRNNDGALNFETHANPEWMIEGVTIELCDDNPSTSCIVTQTDEFGRYVFEDLPSGTYSLKQMHPIQFLDGKDTPGRMFTHSGVPLSAPASLSADDELPNDKFTNIVLDDAHGDYYNFGERGFAAQFLSKRFLTAQAPLMEFGSDAAIFIQVPEPATPWLAAAAAGLGLLPRRRRHSARSLTRHIERSKNSQQ
jgi:hypothetical protein